MIVAALFSKGKTLITFYLFIYFTKLIKLSLALFCWKRNILHYMCKKKRKFGATLCIVCYVQRRRTDTCDFDWTVCFGQMRLRFMQQIIQCEKYTDVFKSFSCSWLRFYDVDSSSKALETFSDCLAILIFQDVRGNF